MKMQENGPEIFKWAVNVLYAKEYQVLSTIPEIVQDKPWSIVYRINTNKGLVFLKKVPEALALEASIIDVLHKAFHAPVPRIIADNQEQHSFLMLDAGIQLHEYFQENFCADILIKILQAYVALQMQSQSKVALFFDMNVPDWQIEKLPILYRHIIDDEKLLLDDGLTKEELFTLQKLESVLFSICEKLSHYKIKNSFGHADFHDKNMLIHPVTQQTTIIDLGEVVITHPFFSLHNCLHMAKENFSLSNEQYQLVKAACIQPWLAYETKENIAAIFALIERCWSIHAVLGEVRLMNSVDSAAFQRLHRQGRLANKLRYWIKQHGE